jgi:hypothetical protein
MTNKTNEQNNSPVKTYRLGRIHAAVWQQESENGSFYNTTIQKRYKDGDEYKSTNSYSAGDLAHVAAVSQLALHWIQAQESQATDES